MIKLLVLLCLSFDETSAFEPIKSNYPSTTIDETDITEELINITRLKIPVDKLLPKSKLYETLETHYCYIYTTYNELLKKRSELYLNLGGVSANQIWPTIDILERFCASAEEALGTQDYIKYFEPLFAYMEIKFFHVTLNLRIQKTSIDNDSLIAELSKTLMSEIEKAKTKYGFDFYTMMEREVHPHHPK